jgi:hypothetical protein
MVQQEPLGQLDQQAGQGPLEILELLVLLEVLELQVSKEELVQQV